MAATEHMSVSEQTVIGLLGSTGNLGSTFLDKFTKMNTSPEISISRVGRTGKLSKGFNVTPDGIIKSSEGTFPDIIVNLSNSYFPKPTPEQEHEMEETILGVAKAISNTIEQSGCAVISASTYFQYCPRELQPWSHYSELKNRAKEIIESTAKKCLTNFTDFVLYDNFGGISRNKFVDLLEHCLFSGSALDSTDGQQVLNLTHVDDLTDAFFSEVQEMIKVNDLGCHSYQLKSDFTTNLRELVVKAENASGRKAHINWGKIHYREREVFELWETGLKSPSTWNPKIDFSTYIERKFQKAIKMGGE